jgi:hypothetical protein
VIYSSCGHLTLVVYVPCSHLALLVYVCFSHLDLFVQFPRSHMAHAVQAHFGHVFLNVYLVNTKEDEMGVKIHHLHSARLLSLLSNGVLVSTRQFQIQNQQHFRTVCRSVGTIDNLLKFLPSFHRIYTKHLHWSLIHTPVMRCTILNCVSLFHWCLCSYEFFTLALLIQESGPN